MSVLEQNLADARTAAIMITAASDDHVGSTKNADRIVRSDREIQSRTIAPRTSIASFAA
jgi:hypothetical protein